MPDLRQITSLSRRRKAKRGALRLSAVCGPRIDRIEPFLTDLILIHFDTEANRDYQLQYAESATAPEASWITLYPAPNLPFPNHYIVPDSRTHAHRFYRLKVTP